MTDKLTATPSANPFAARDRVLLYTRGMDLGPVRGVELALESMRAAGEGASTAEVMEELYRIMRENGASPLLTAPDGERLVSAPPMNRRRMIARDMDQLSLTGALKQTLRSLFAALRG